MPSSRFRFETLRILASIGLAASAYAAEPTPSPTPVKMIPVEGAMVTQANQTLALASLPALPAKAVEYQCYSWSGLSAGIYASFVLDQEGFDGWLASLPSGMNKTSPVPSSLLSPPNSQAPWFAPSQAEGTYILAAGTISRGAPQILRVYADPENKKIQFYYSWNNKRTYP